MMSLEHRRLRRSLDAYVDGELDPVEAEAVSSHLDDCPGCNDITRQIRRIKRALQRAGDRRSSPVVMRRLRDFASVMTTPRTG